MLWEVIMGPVLKGIPFFKKGVPFRTGPINISLAILCGILTFLAFPPFDLAPLAWVCLVPLLVVIAKSSKSLYKTFFYGYLSGVVFFSGAVYWLGNVTVPGMIVLVLYLSIFYGIFGLFSGIIFKYSMDYLIIAFLWVIIEYLRANLCTGFPWVLLGYSQYQNINLIQVADISGVYGVSFLLAVFNIAIFSLVVLSKRKVAYLVSALIFLIAAITYSKYKLDNYHIWASPRISVIQGNIPQEYKWDVSYADNIVIKYTDLTEKAALDKSDMIIWPETSYPYIFDESSGSADEISELASRLSLPILVGIISTKGDDYYNSAMLFSAGGEMSKIYHKIHLVPYGEYLPFEEYLSFLRKYIDKPIGDFKRGDDYVLFPLKSLNISSMGHGTKVRETYFYKFGVLICFEDIFPYISREFVIRGANFLVNITNDAWFGYTGAARQHLQASVFRAVENRVPVVRSANTGISCFIDATGKIIGKVKEKGRDTFITGYLAENINVGKTKSFYTKAGDVFVYFCGFMLIFMLITERVLLNKKK